jgi:hypothetical protein
MPKPIKEYSDYKKFCENKLQTNEVVKTWGSGYIGEMMGSGDKRQYNGCLIVTDKRVAFYSKSWMSEVFEEIPLKKISSVESKMFLGHTTLSIHTSNNTLAFKSLIPEEARLLQDTINESTEYKSIEDNSSQLQINEDDIFSKMEKLGDLKLKGIITQEEFQLKKEELLKKVS